MQRLRWPIYSKSVVEAEVVSDGGAAELMRSTSKSAAEVIAAVGMPELGLHFPE
jgi:hypothetical protein